MKTEADKPVQELKAHLKKHPKDADGYYELGVAYARQGDMGLACRQWRKVLELQPSHSAARYFLGMAYLSQGKLQQAIAQYRTALEHNPKDHYAYNNLGLVLAR